MRLAQAIDGARDVEPHRILFALRFAARAVELRLRLVERAVAAPELDRHVQREPEHRLQRRLLPEAVVGGRTP